MQQIIILGATGGCVDILDTIIDVNASLGEAKFRCLGFLDDNESLWGKKVLGVEVLGPFSSVHEYSNCYFVTGIGSAKNYWARQKIIQSLSIPEDRFATIIHPSASISSTASLGWGTVIHQHVTITTNVNIGNQILVLPNTTISHDTTVADFSIINAGVHLSGTVNIGRCCYLGANSSVKEYISVGNRSLLGMGSVVLQDVDEGMVVAGNPATILRKVVPK